MKSKSIRTKLRLILFGIALIPLAIVITFFTVNNITHAVTLARRDGDLRNKMAQEHLTDLFEKNFSVLKAVAVNPMVRDYIKSSAEKDKQAVEAMLEQTNQLFGDGNNTILTDSNAQQLFRTDGFPLVNVKQRSYYWLVMSGMSVVSNVLVSLSNSRLIAVLAVPVYGEDGIIIGMVQCDYNLDALQLFVRSLSDGRTQVLITDAAGYIAAHSSEPLINKGDLRNIGDNPAVKNALAGNQGSALITISPTEYSGKRKVLASYARNSLMRWAVVSEYPYSIIVREILASTGLAVIIGLLVLVLVAGLSSFIAERAMKKIRAVSAFASSAADDQFDAEALSVLGDDELGQMVTAINKIRFSRDSFRKAAEVDKLTGLLNKATFERLCRRQLAGAQDGCFSAMLVCDLDNFKTVNDTLGHQTGDAVLHDFGEVLHRLFRPSDLIGRFGSDEFVVFLHDIPGKEIALQKAERILEAASTVLMGVEQIKVTASIGIAARPQHGSDYAALFGVADRSVYKVKEAGRNGICFGEETVSRP